MKGGFLSQHIEDTLNKRWVRISAYWGCAIWTRMHIRMKSTINESLFKLNKCTVIWTIITCNYYVILRNYCCLLTWYAIYFLNYQKHKATDKFQFQLNKCTVIWTTTSGSYYVVIRNYFCLLTSFAIYFLNYQKHKATDKFQFSIRNTFSPYLRDSGIDLYPGLAPPHSDEYITLL